MNNQPTNIGGVPDPAELKALLGQLIGQTYGELNKLDQNIIGATPTLRHKSAEFRQAAAAILKDSEKLFVAEQQPPQQQQQPVNVVNMPVSQPAANAQITTLPVIETTTRDNNQLEFNFDNTATAQKIYDLLSDIKTAIKVLQKTVDKQQEAINALEKKS